MRDWIWGWGGVGLDGMGWGMGWVEWNGMGWGRCRSLVWGLPRVPAAPRVVSASAGIDRLGGGGGDVQKSDVDRGRGRAGLARGALLVLLRWAPTGCLALHNPL